MPTFIALNCEYFYNDLREPKGLKRRRKKGFTQRREGARVLGFKALASYRAHKAEKN